LSLRVGPRAVVGESVEEIQEGRSRRARRRLDDVRVIPDPLFARRRIRLLLVEVLEADAGMLGVLAKVVVRAARDPFELAPAPRVLVLDVVAVVGVMGELVRAVATEAELRLVVRVAQIPLEAGVLPHLERLGLLPRLDEVLALHLLELARAEDEMLDGDLVPERLPHLSDAEGKLERH